MSKPKTPPPKSNPKASSNPYWSSLTPEQRERILAAGLELQAIVDRNPPRSPEEEKEAAERHCGRLCVIIPAPRPLKKRHSNKTTGGYHDPH